MNPIESPTIVPCESSKIEVSELSGGHGLGEKATQPESREGGSPSSLPS